MGASIICNRDMGCTGSKELPLFIDYAIEKQIHSEFEFWRVAILFQKKANFNDQKQMKKEARRIIKTFLRKGAEKEIVMNKSVIVNIQKSMEKPFISNSIFQEAILEISGLLEHHFRTFVIKHKIKLKTKLDIEKPLDMVETMSFVLCYLCF